MGACEVVRLLVDKAIVPAELKRCGNLGYGRVKALRLLVYARLKSLDNDTRVVEHLKKHTQTFVEHSDYAKCQIELLLADGGDAT